MKPGTRLKLRVFTLFLGVFLCGVCNVQSVELTREMKQERAKEQKRDAQTARDILKKQAYYHFFLEDYLTAATDLKLLEAAAKAENDTATLNESRRLLGSLYLAWGMDRSASRLFNELVETTPADEEKTGLLRVVQKMQYDRTLYHAALETYRLFATTKKASGMDQAVYLAGMSHYSIGSVQEGIGLLESITPDSRYFPYAQLALAKSYFRSNNLPKSLLLFQKISRFDTNNNILLRSFIEKSRLTWGQLLIEEGRYSEAGSVLRGIPEESPFYSDALFSMGWAAFRNQDDLEALVIFQDLIKRDPGDPYALESLTVVGHAYRRLEADATALDHYSDAIDVYQKEEEKIRDFQRLIQDPVQLAILLEIEHGDELGELTHLVKEDDALRFWVGQYRGLTRLVSYLDQKLRDTGVFQIMVDHREAVFRQALPSLDHSLAKDPVAHLREKETTLNARVTQAIQKEKLVALAVPDEEKAMLQLATAQRNSLVLGKQIKAMAKRIKAVAKRIKMPELQMSSEDPLNTDKEDVAELVELKKEWENVDRALKLAEGELIWKISTEVPGRADDLNRGLRQLRSDLSQMEEAYARLVLSVPVLERDIVLFRGRIKDAQARLAGQRERTIRLTERLLPALQNLLLREINRKRDRVVSWIAAAELSQIQILDAREMTSEMNSEMNSEMH